MSWKIKINFKKADDDLTFEKIITQLPVKVKVAFYRVASQRTIKRGTWNGCAFNAAGEAIGRNVTSEVGAVEAFGASKYIVSNFIRFWDGTKFRGGDWSSDAYATAQLVKLIDAYGLLKPPASAQIEEYEDAAGLDDFLMDAELRGMIEAIEVNA